MKKLASLILIGIALVPFSLYADYINRTTLHVTVCDGFDCGDVTAPTAPDNLTVTGVTASQVNLAWDASIDPGTPAFGVLGYLLFRDGSATAFATTSGTSYSDTGLSEGTLYSYRVKAFDVAYNQSAFSSSVSTTTLVTPSDEPVASNGSPSSLQPAGTRQVTLSLDTDIDATCRYGTQAGVAYASIPNTFTATGGTHHTTTVTGLTNGTTRTYYVRCQSSTLTDMLTDYIISFSVAESAGSSGSSLSKRLPSISDNPITAIIKGTTYPGATVQLLKDGQLVAITQANTDGTFEFQLPQAGEGTFTFNLVTVNAEGERSPLVPFTISLANDKTTVVSDLQVSAPEKSTLAGRSDFSGDGKVNLVDFSMMIYWYKRPLELDGRRFDLNSDGMIDLVDFSIFVYHWTS